MHSAMDSVVRMAFVVLVCSPAMAAPEPAAQRQADANGRFSAEFPAGYQVKSKAGALKGICGDCLVSIKEEASEDADGEAYAVRVLERAKMDLKCTVLASGKGKLAENASQWHELAWKGVPDAPEMKMRMLMIVAHVVTHDKKRGYVVACSAPEEKFAEAKNVFEAIAASVRLTKED